MYWWYIFNLFAFLKSGSVWIALLYTRLIAFFWSLNKSVMLILLDPPQRGRQ